uniref:TFIIS-type domain-containing protein n=1 Tax=Strongyloides papillosus TaxID=174720 RepID=A0A0N5B9F4_STREA
MIPEIEGEKDHNECHPPDEVYNDIDLSFDNKVPEVMYENELYEEYQIYVDEGGKEYIYMNGEPILLEEANDVIYEEAIQDYDDEQAYHYFKETQFIDPPIIVGGNKRKRKKQCKNQNKSKTRETAYDNMKIVDRKTCSQQKLTELIDKNSTNIKCLSCNMEYFITKQLYGKYKVVVEKDDEGGSIFNFVCPVCSIRTTCALV